MANEKYDVAQLLNKAFGTKEVIRYPDANQKGGSSSPRLDYSGVTVKDEETLDQEMSWLNTPIIFPITFKGGTYKIYRNGRIQNKQLSDFRLPAVAIATFSRSKLKKKTQATAGKGAVKELYGIEDWQITIQGLCLNEPGHPQAVSFLEQEARLLEFDEVAGSIAVSGAQFSAKRIFRMDIDKIDLKTITGKERALAFTIKGESDEPLELIL